jgi:NAD(P)-dependent dehydrogenase (short-subunit alcohol dehydrogenase family)
MPELPHPALKEGATAVVTGAASGIGLAASRRLVAMGLNVVMADRSMDALASAFEQIEGSRPARMRAAVGWAVDVSRPEEVECLREKAEKVFGPVSVLMNNAGVGANPGKPWENAEGWRALLDVNLWGVIHGVQAFVPAMLASGGPGLVINTGSKQGITLPPSNGAHNLSKAGVKAFTETLAYELHEAAGDRVTAHLLIPGFTFTGMTGRTKKPAAAWTSDQVVDFMLESLARRDFYMLCPDNDVPRPLDERRAQWMADDLIKNRPALSRWRADYKAAFEAFVRTP